MAKESSIALGTVHFPIEFEVSHIKLLLFLENPLIKMLSFIFHVISHFFREFFILWIVFNFCLENLETHFLFSQQFGELSHICHRMEAIL